MRIGAGRLEPEASREDGGFTLEARSAAVRGKSLRYEGDQDCLGYWRDRDAHAEWALEFAEPGEFEVVLTYACAPSEAGWTVEVRADGEAVARAPLAATDSWTDYRTVVLGTVAVASGDHRITVHGDKDEGPLMKLRRLELRPRR